MPSWRTIRCPINGALPRSIATAAVALKDQLDVEVELIVGHSGIFEVAVDGTVVAAKTRAGFPTPEEVVESVARVLRPVAT